MLALLSVKKDKSSPDRKKIQLLILTIDKPFPRLRHQAQLFERRLELTQG